MPIKLLSIWYNTVIACVIPFMVSHDVVVDIGSEYFFVYLSCVYKDIYSGVYVRLVMPSYLLFCCIYSSSTSFMIVSWVPSAPTNVSIYE